MTSENVSMTPRQRRPQKALLREEKIHELNYIKMQDFCSSKYSFIEGRCPQHVRRKLIRRICDGALLIKMKRTDSPAEKLANRLNKHLTDEVIQTPDKRVERS